MEIAIVAAGFTPGEADQLRRSMASFKANGKLHLYEKKMVEGMTARGYEEDFSRRVFKQLQGFEGYGFPESHAASFALLVYISSWLKCHYPDVFCAALLNSQPMGFYQPAQIVRMRAITWCAGIAVDVNYSEWDNTLEQKGGKYLAVRLGFRQVKGLREEDMLNYWWPCATMGIIILTSCALRVCRKRPWKTGGCGRIPFDRCRPTDGAVGGLRFGRSAHRLI
jgi:error-prone DNA polymerase